MFYAGADLHLAAIAPVQTPSVLNFFNQLCLLQLVNLCSGFGNESINWLLFSRTELPTSKLRGYGSDGTYLQPADPPP